MAKVQQNLAIILFSVDFISFSIGSIVPVVEILLIHNAKSSFEDLIRRTKSFENSITIDYKKSIFGFGIANVLCIFVSSSGHV